MNAAAPPGPHDIYRLTCLRELLAAHGVRLKQTLGQNFLHDRNVIEKIVRHAGIQPSDIVLEIGAGMGHLTLALARAAARVVAVETDARLIPLLTEILAPLPNVTIIHADILAQPLASFCSHHALAPTVLAANLPYYITTPLIEEVVTSGLPLRSLSCTVQQEAAERLMALPGQRAYGPAAVLLRLWGTPAVGSTISPQCFFPRPAVRSCTLHLCPHQPPLITPRLWQPVAHLVRHVFRQRRKTLANALAAVCHDGRSAAAWLAAAGLPHAARAEQLDPTAFLRLAACAPIPHCALHSSSTVPQNSLAPAPASSIAPAPCASPSANSRT